MATRADEQITLAGPPRSARAIVRLDAGGVRVATVALKVGDGVVVHKVYLRPFGADATELRLRLPRETPPGSYSGEVSLGERRTGIRVAVEAVVRLRVHPQLTRLSLPPRGTGEFPLTLQNRGNVPFEIPKAVALDFDEDQQGRALGRALRASLPEGERRVDRFFEELREVHGGEGKVVVLEGAGRLLPADARELRCRVELPESMRPGRAYRGAWQLGDHAHVLEVQVTSSGPVIREGRVP
jgi:hypothetical protein